MFNIPLLIDNQRKTILDGINNKSEGFKMFKHETDLDNFVEGVFTNFPVKEKVTYWTMSGPADVYFYTDINGKTSCPVVSRPQFMKADFNNIGYIEDYRQGILEIINEDLKRVLEDGLEYAFGMWVPVYSLYEKRVMVHYSKKVLSKEVKK
jgi:hypothetical protein